VAKPYKSEGSKREQVEAMFDSIAHRYDFLNHFLSLGIDKIWRRKIVRLAKELPSGAQILDVATGTADLAIALSMLRDVHIIGVDISAGMLAIGKRKVEDKKLDEIIQLQQADSEKLPFDDDSFHLATAAFGVRNFEHLETGLSEMYRVVKNGGRAIILEFSKPAVFPVKQMYNLYFRYWLPFIGRLFSRDKRAYTYLPESVQEFPEDQDFLNKMKKVGFHSMRQKRLSFGIASLYIGYK